MICSRCGKSKDLRLKENGDPYKICADCAEYRKLHLKEHALHSRNYYYNHIEKELERRKKYREEHHDEIYMKIKCDNCGCMVCKHGMTRHMRSKKCMNHSLN